MLTPVRIPFGEYLPDLPSLGNPGALLAKNVFPAERSYRPFADFEPFSSALPTRALGGFSARASDGNITVFSGTATKLYALTAASTTWTDVSRTSGGNYATDEHWSFCQFGNYVTAWNGIDAAQVYEMGVSTVFAALGGSPPVARYATSVREQVMVGNVSSYRSRVQFCGIDSLTTWGSDPTLLSDYQDIQGIGAIMALVGLSSPHIWCERGIAVGTFSGPPTGWQFDTVIDNKGTIFPKSVVGWGSVSFGWCDDGIYQFNGAALSPISQGKVSKSFFDRLDQGYPDRINAGIDPIAQCVHWAVPFSGHSGGNPNYIVSYHWPTGKWSETEISLEYLILAANSFGFTLETLDTVSASIETLPYSLDSRVWSATGSAILAAFDSNHKLAFPTGDNLQATLDTPEANLFPGKRGFVKRAWPLIEGTSVSPTITPISRNLQHEAVTTGSAVAVNSIGYAPLRNNARYQRVRVIIPAASTWTHAHGIEFEAVQAGRR